MVLKFNASRYVCHRQRRLFSSRQALHTSTGLDDAGGESGVSVAQVQGLPAWALIPKFEWRTADWRGWQAMQVRKVMLGQAFHTTFLQNIIPTQVMSRVYVFRQLHYANTLFPFLYGEGVVLCIPET